jgi:RNA polymerase sigma-70 factor, ECF subfamily
MMVTSEDSHLMRRIDRREAGALHELYQQYHAPVYGYLLRVLQDPSDAEDVAQDIFLTIWKGPRRWRSQQGRLINWLIAVARNQAVDRIRRHARSVEARVAVTGELPALSDDHRVLRDLLAQLPADLQRPITCVFFLGMDESEIARDLGVSPAEAKRRLRAGLQALRAQWQESLQQD